MKGDKKNINFRLIGCLIFSFLIFASSNTAQETKPAFSGYSINPKIGIYFGKKNPGVFGGAEINLIRHKMIYSADFYSSKEFNIFGNKSPKERFKTFGVMIGGYHSDNIFRIQYQAGLSSIWGLKRTEFITSSGWYNPTDFYKTKNYFTIGLVTKLGFKIIPRPYLSIGLDLQTNINSENQVFIPMISIEIGKLRN